MGRLTHKKITKTVTGLCCFRHVISELKTYTQYLVSLQVINPKGAGPGSTVVVMTNEGGKIESFPRIIYSKGNHFHRAEGHKNYFSEINYNLHFCYGLAWPGIERHFIYCILRTFI